MKAGHVIGGVLLAGVALGGCGGADNSTAPESSSGLEFTGLRGVPIEDQTCDTNQPGTLDSSTLPSGWIIGQTPITSATICTSIPGSSDATTVVVPDNQLATLTELLSRPDLVGQEPIRCLRYAEAPRGVVAVQGNGQPMAVHIPTNECGFYQPEITEFFGSLA